MVCSIIPHLISYKSESLNVSDFVVGCSWSVGVGVSLKKAPLSVRNRREKSKPMRSATARSDALPTARNGAQRLAILAGRSLPDAGEPPGPSSGIRCPVDKPLVTMMCDDHNRLFFPGMNMATYGVMAGTTRGEARYEAPALPYERCEEKGRG